MTTPDYDKGLQIIFHIHPDSDLPAYAVMSRDRVNAALWKQSSKPAVIQRCEERMQGKQAFHRASA